MPIGADTEVLTPAVVKTAPVSTPNVAPQEGASQTPVLRLEKSNVVIELSSAVSPLIGNKVADLQLERAAVADAAAAANTTSARAASELDAQVSAQRLKDSFTQPPKKKIGAGLHSEEMQFDELYDLLPTLTLLKSFMQEKGVDFHNVFHLSQHGWDYLQTFLGRLDRRRPAKAPSRRKMGGQASGNGGGSLTARSPSLSSTKKVGELDELFAQWFIATPGKPTPRVESVNDE